MIREAVAIAHPNVALSKYWGKRDVPGNVPAVPSLSVTLGGLRTRTRVRWSDDPREPDRLMLNGRALDRTDGGRIYAFLDFLRRKLDVRGAADVETDNDFPTASGLASSASGFAALTLAAMHAAGAGTSWPRVADLARQGSVSAARSVLGGFVELDVAGAARPFAAADRLPLVVLVCVTAEGPKSIGSTDGMRITMDRSPYGRAWLETAPRIHAALCDGLVAGDFARVGELAEASAMAMHASAIAAGVTYWNGVTVEALAAVRALRTGGTPAYATIDAGPHVKVLAQPQDAARVRGVMEAIPGVRRIIEAHPGEGARVEGAT